MGSKPVVEIDGARFTTLEEFAEHFSAAALDDYSWRGNLDAFNDVLRGGFGTPEGGFVLRWINSTLSRQRLGYAETVRQLERVLSKCHPANRSRVAAEIEAARSETGPTVFDWLVEIIETHGENGAEAEDGVELELR